jgi:hypothetical protein
MNGASGKFNPAQSPLVLDEWRKELRGYDVEASKSILSWIEHGARLNFVGERKRMECPPRDMPSDVRQAVTEDLKTELQLGRIIGPFKLDDCPFPRLRVSPVWAVPKKDGGWRRIHNLSWPSRDEDSVNAGVANVSTQYGSIDDAVQAVQETGAGCFCVKVDLQSAYRHIRLHPDDWELLGMRIGDLFYVDCFLPFGAASAPRIFNTFADALAFIARRHFPAGVQVWHYLDDYLFFAPSQQAAAAALDTFRSLCRRLGVSIKEAKTVAPTTRVPVLGLVLDSGKMCLEADPAKLAALVCDLKLWIHRDSCSVQQLDSLIGSLSFVARAIRLARSFLRRMIECRYAAKGSVVRLSHDFRRDVAWWLRFAEQWNGVEFVSHRPIVEARSLELFTDASGVMVGAFFAGSWLQLALPVTSENVVSQADSISVKELYAIIIAAATWADRLSGCHVVFRVDNSAAEHALNSKSSRIPRMMWLIRQLLFLACVHGFSFHSVRVAGVNNSIADALSRNSLSLFHSLVPFADALPTPPVIPPSDPW